jgi:hypothetical protein
MNKTHKHEAAKTPLEAADELATERNMVSDTTRTTKGEDFGTKGSFFYLIPYFRAYYLASLEFDSFQWSFDTSSCSGLVIAADHPEHGRRSFLITEMSQGGPLTNELIPEAQNYIRGYMEMLVQEASIWAVPLGDLQPRADNDEHGRSVLTIESGIDNASVLGIKSDVASRLIKALFKYDYAGDVLAKHVRDVRSRNTPQPVH